MIGFDRPTWIKLLNPRTTWFITGQFFWSYVNGTALATLRGGDPQRQRGAVLLAEEPEPGHRAGERPQHRPSCQWANGIYAGQSERTQDATTCRGNADKFLQWEMLITLAATSASTAGGTFVPFVAIAIDPVNRNFLSQLKLDYFLTNNLIIQGRANFYNDLGSGSNSLDPWGAGGLNARRDEVGLRSPTSSDRLRASRCRGRQQSAGPERARRARRSVPPPRRHERFLEPLVSLNSTAFP